MKWNKISTGHYRSEDDHFVLRECQYSPRYGVYANVDNPPLKKNYPRADSIYRGLFTGMSTFVDGKTIKETQEKFAAWHHKNYVPIERLNVEAYQISLEDLDNTLMGIIDIQTTFDVIAQEEDELSVLNPAFFDMFELFIEMYDWRNEKLYRWLPKILCFKTIITTDGHYVFAIRQGDGGFYTGQGLWIVNEVRGEPLVVGTARLVFDKDEDGKPKKRTQPMLVVINDATNLCALEFGTKTKADDDPNQSTSMRSHFEWNPNPGFVTNYFQEEPDIEPTVIPGKDSKVVGDGYTPKRLKGGWRGSRKDGR